VAIEPSKREQNYNYWYNESRAVGRMGDSVDNTHSSGWYERRAECPRGKGDAWSLD